MKKSILLLIFLCLAVLINAQTIITSGMSGTQLRNALNANYDTLFNGKFRSGVEIGEPNRDSRIDSVVVDGLDLKFYQGAQILNSFGSGMFFNISTYGAKGDGITNDASAFNSCMAATIAANGIMFFPSGTYNIPGAQSFNLTNKKIRITGSGNVKIVGNQQIWTFTTTPGANDTFTASPNINAEVLSTTSLYSSVVQGDILAIQSTDDIINSAIGFYKKGELVEVQKISGSNIYVTGPTYSGYRMSTTIIKDLNVGSVKFDNINFEQIQLAIYYCRDVAVTSCGFKNINGVNIDLHYVFNAMIDNNVIQHNSVGYYGIESASSQNIDIIYNKISNMGQAVEAGGTYPARNLLYGWNTITCFSPTSWAQLGVHGHCEFVKIIGNKVFNGGIYAVGQNIDIIDNTITIGYSRSLSYNIGIERVEEDLNNDASHLAPISRYMNITGNVVFSTDSLLDCSGIFINMQTFRDTIDWVNISNNFIKTSGYALLVGGTPQITNEIRNLNINNNYFEQYKVNSSYYNIYFAASNNYKNVIINGNILKGKAYGNMMGVCSMEDFKFTNNTIYHGTGPYPDTYFSNGRNSETSQLVIENNTYLEGSNICVAGSWHHALVKNNTFKNIPSINWYALQVQICDTVTFINNNYDRVNIGISGGNAATQYRNEMNYFHGNLTDGAPTAAEVNGIVGKTAVNMINGYTAIIKDTNGTGLTYNFRSNGTDWIMDGLPVKLL